MEIWDQMTLSPVLPAITDPAWFYSALAQSAAALVAILGGFITSRMLTFSLEKRGLQSRLDSLQAQRQALVSRRASLIEAYESYRVQNALDDCWELLSKKYQMDCWDFDREHLGGQFAESSRRDIYEQKYREFAAKAEEIRTAFFSSARDDIREGKYSSAQEVAEALGIRGIVHPDTLEAWFEQVRAK